MKTDLFESATTLHLGPVFEQSPLQLKVPFAMAAEISSTTFVPARAVHLQLEISTVGRHDVWSSSILRMTTVVKSQPGTLVHERE